MDKEIEDEDNDDDEDGEEELCGKVRGIKSLCVLVKSISVLFIFVFVFDVEMVVIVSFFSSRSCNFML